MTDRHAEISPNATARAAGLFYSLTTITGMLAVTIGGKLFVSKDPAATAANVLAHADWAWIGPAVNLVATACYLVVTALVYELLKPVNRSLARLAILFSLVGCATGAASESFDLAPSLLLAGGATGSAFSPGQLQALAYTFFRMNGTAYDIAMVFFGFYCILTGWLAFRSTFLPRVVGILMVIAGLGWLTFLSPPLHRALSGYTDITGLLGEGVFALWLLVFGVDKVKWHAASARTRDAGRVPLTEIA
jgi:hypothetical protein